jgi:hypothetical protein
MYKKKLYIQRRAKAAQVNVEQKKTQEAGRPLQTSITDNTPNATIGETRKSKTA